MITDSSGIENNPCSNKADTAKEEFDIIKNALIIEAIKLSANNIMKKHYNINQEVYYAR